MRRASRNRGGTRSASRASTAARLGKVANCQVAVTAALWTGVRAWMLGAALYLPEEWLTPDARQRAQIPAAIRFQEKWRLALALLRQARASGVQVTAVLGDAEFGDNGTLRQYLHRAGLPYALGISSHLTVFREAGTSALAVRAIAEQLPRRAWRVVTWRNGTNRPWKAHFAALRVTPAQRWPHRRRAPEVWLLCERDLGATPRIKYYFVALPATASRTRPGAAGASAVGHRAAVPRAQRRTGTRSLRGTVVCRVASPRRPDRPGVHLAATRTSTRRRAVADPAGRPSGDHGDLDGAFLRDAAALLEDHAETRGNRSANLTK